MASIFTFEPDLPRVSSPWARQLESIGLDPDVRDIEALRAVARLEPEPQEGPVEYKLHLLMRTRRSFTNTKSLSDVVMSDSFKLTGAPAQAAENENASPSSNGITGSGMTAQARQHRLEQLTTQLLWRLQQSAAIHASSASNVILPVFPEAMSSLRPPPRPARLVNGLEESQGALYEIGVADDGTFVGLAEDEMYESINNLRAMAACLGCEVEVLRMVQIGVAEWLQETAHSGKTVRSPMKSKLVVCEALVKPCLNGDTSPSTAPDTAPTEDLAGPGLHSITQSTDDDGNDARRQIRVSLTGATLSGKSSLLGTLTTSALDNARGKSRLTMLKHRHEISSGQTSSVSQELLGYADTLDGDVEVINYATENVSSWADIHAAACRGRLVLVSDSAGHPRFRRTAVKGLVGWAPHWTLVCISGTEEDVTTATQPGISAAMTPDIDLTSVYLDLCLKLHLPIVVVITKLDVASKTTLRTTLANVLTLLKDNGRRPRILSTVPHPTLDNEPQLLSSDTRASVANLIAGADFDPSTGVPIVMTSAVQGTGITMLHALLSALPPPLTHADDLHHPDEPLFHVEDVYSKTGEIDTTIVAGYLRRSHISIGDKLYIGPFSLDSTEDSEDSDAPRQRRPSAHQTSRSFPGAYKSSSNGQLASMTHRRAEDMQVEWQEITVQSIRNLRVPVTKLRADQVGTIGFATRTAPSVFVSARSGDASPRLSAMSVSRIKKGMVILRGPGRATSCFTARFRRTDLETLAVGSQVVVYIASVRASARVISGSVSESAPGSPARRWSTNAGDDLNMAHLSLHGDHALPDVVTNVLRSESDIAGPVAGAITHEHLLVVLQLDGSREFVEVGSRVLIMPGGGPAVSGIGAGGATLEGFVGTVTDVA